MRRWMLSFLLVSLLASVLLSACAKADGPAAAVEAYLQALVNQKGDSLTALACAQWENQAALELDSFQAVTAKLQGLACKSSGTDGDASLVHCQGKIITTYNAENQELDLSTRTYKVVQEGGEWRVCGYR